MPCSYRLPWRKRAFSEPVNLEGPDKVGPSISIRRSICLFCYSKNCFYGQKTAARCPNEGDLDVGTSCKMRKFSSHLRKFF
jgi:hypothetical protein